ncbi:3D-(3,5/4)-trihydroxycyclohexane-1,2-dione hydrolase [Lacticaseibacillus paracasei subsp. paracasei CNCM I-4648]|nr:3D-(3,5/4)-trihydroxycyclohexane-1,2-dione hydrolase [Lacticaseibacillus paracasei subsp. paracasei CNCM I-4648]
MTATELNAQVAADAKKETIRLTTAQALVRF